MDMTKANELLARSNEEIDKLTLELLLNKNHYSKYLLHTDAKKYEEFREFKSKLQICSEEIIDITKSLIENPKKIINSDVEELFEAYAKSVIRYLEMKDVETSNDFNKKEEDDEDTLFGNMEEDIRVNEKEKENNIPSFWSKERVVKSSQSMMPADLRMFKGFKK